MTGKPVGRECQPYGIVPIALLECRSLSPLARLVAAWIVSKPAGWEVRPTALQAALGISEKKWLSASKSMRLAGIFKQSKRPGPDGKWVWDSDLDLAPILGTIPPLGMHGEPVDIELRFKNKERYTKGLIASAHVANKIPSRKNENLDELKKFHIGFVLNDLDIEWYETGAYIEWDNARQTAAGFRQMG